MNQITYFDYITGITLGTIAASISVEEHVTLSIGLLSLITWTVLTIIVSLISLKSYKARNFLDGEPDIIIKKGEIMQKSLQKVHLNMDDITMLLREKDIFDITEVEYAILEPHGKLSVLKKEDSSNITKKDMNITCNLSLFLPTDIVIDGKIIQKNLKEIGKNESWLIGELAKYDLMLSDTGKVFYMSVLRDGNTYVNMKN